MALNTHSTFRLSLLAAVLFIVITATHETSAGDAALAKDDGQNPAVPLYASDGSKAPVEDKVSKFTVKKQKIKVSTTFDQQQAEILSENLFAEYKMDISKMKDLTKLLQSLGDSLKDLKYETVQKFDAAKLEIFKKIQIQRAYEENSRKKISKSTNQNHNQKRKDNIKSGSEKLETKEKIPTKKIVIIEKEKDNNDKNETIKNNKKVEPKRSQNTKIAISDKNSHTKSKTKTKDNKTQKMDEDISNKDKKKRLPVKAKVIPELKVTETPQPVPEIPVTALKTPLARKTPTPTPGTKSSAHKTPESAPKTPTPAPKTTVPAPKIPAGASKSSAPAPKTSPISPKSTPSATKTKATVPKDSNPKPVPRVSTPPPPVAPAAQNVPPPATVPTGVYTPPSNDNIFNRFIYALFGKFSGVRDEKWSRPWQTHKEHKRVPSSVTGKNKSVDTSSGFIGQAVNKLVATVFGNTSSERDPKYSQPWKTHEEHLEKAISGVKSKKYKVTKVVGASGGILHTLITLVFPAPSGHRDKKYSEPWQTHEEQEKKFEPTSSKKEKFIAQASGGILDKFVRLIFPTPIEERNAKYAHPWQKHEGMDRKDIESTPAEIKNAEAMGGPLDKLINILFYVDKDAERDPKYAQPWQTHADHAKKPRSEKELQKKVIVMSGGFPGFGFIDKIVSVLFGSVPTEREDKWSQPWQTHKEHRRLPVLAKPQEKKLYTATDGLFDKLVNTLFGTNKESERDSKWSQPWQSHEDSVPIERVSSPPVTSSDDSVDTPLTSKVKKSPSSSSIPNIIPSVSTPADEEDKVEGKKIKLKPTSTKPDVQHFQDTKVSEIKISETSIYDKKTSSKSTDLTKSNKPNVNKSPIKLEEKQCKQEKKEFVHQNKKTSTLGNKKSRPKKKDLKLKENISKEENKIPKVVKKIPKEKKTPKVEKKTLKVEKKIPEEKNTPEVGIKIPEEKKAPKVEKKIPKDKKTPTVENKTPKVEKKTPKVEKKTPKVEKKTPKDKKIPTVENKTPKVEKKTSKVEKKTPKVEKKTPKDKKIPTAENKTPKVEKKTPKVEKKTPKDKKTPKVEKKTPKVEKKTPKEKKIPTVENNTPKVEKNTPKMEKKTPKIEKKTPKIGKKTSNVKVKTSKSEKIKTIHTKTNKALKVKSKIKETKKSLTAKGSAGNKFSSKYPQIKSRRDQVPSNNHQNCNNKKKSPSLANPVVADFTSPSAEEEEEEEDEDDEQILVPSSPRSRDHIDAILGLDEPSRQASKKSDPIADATLSELKGIYSSSVKSLEETYKYMDISNRHMSDAEIFGQPLVLILGPYSTGKSTFLNYLMGLEFTKRALQTGAHPSHGVFRVLQYGSEDQELDGTALSAHNTFRSLQKFGQNFVDQLRGHALNVPLLKKVTFVEAPGILEMRRAGERQYPFNDVLQWFIDRADLVLVMFDYTKLDAGYELEAALDQLKGRESQVRILLNKADQIPPEELIKVQGSLFWNLSPLLGVSAPPTVYAGSFSSRPYRMSSPAKLFQAQEQALLHDIAKAVNNRVDNRVAIARRHSVRVRNHAQMVDTYLNTYNINKGFLTSKHKLADDIVENPHLYNIYEGMGLITNVSRYDLPDPEVYRDFFRVHNLYDFPTLKSTCTYLNGCPLEKIDKAISSDLPELLAKHRRLLTRAGISAPLSTPMDIVGVDMRSNVPQHTKY